MENEQRNTQDQLGNNVIIIQDKQVKTMSMDPSSHQNIKESSPEEILIEEEVEEEDDDNEEI